MQTITPELQTLLSQLSQYVTSGPSNLNLPLLWSQYKTAKAKLVAATTQKGDWPEVDRALNFVTVGCLELTTTSATLLLADLLERYSISTTRKVLLYARAAAYWGIEEELIVVKNPYSRLFKNIPKVQKSSRSRKCFEKPEIEHILAAFASNEFCSKFSVHSHSHSFYRGYVEFLNLTGFRPEEAIALTWGDIKNTEIVVTKAYSKGILKSTKTYEAREFPVNSQLGKFLGSLPRTQRLVFPSVQGYRVHTS